MVKKKIGVCHYHLCRKRTKIFLCKFCKDFYCKEHIKPKVPGVFPGGDRHSNIDMQSWRESGHPDSFYSRFKEQKEQEEGRRYEEALKRLTKGPVIKYEDRQQPRVHPEKREEELSDLKEKYYDEAEKVSKDDPHRNKKRKERRSEFFEKHPLKETYWRHDTGVPKPHERYTPFAKKLITLIIIAIIGVSFLFFYKTGYLQDAVSTASKGLSDLSNKQPDTGSQYKNLPSNPTTTQTFIQPKQYTLEELRNYAAQLINEDRAKRGLSSVVLGTNNAAQQHAEDMLKNRFLSHWGTDGYKPYMRYTNNGGRGSVAENAAFSGFFYYEPNAATIDPKEDIAKHEYQMMNDDASSNWGHRDNIIDKNHNKVNIGIAYDSTHLAYVQDFEDDYISWSEPITYNSGILSMAGTSSLGTIQSVALYYDPTPKSLSQSDLLSYSYSGAYGLGPEAGYIIEPGYSMTGTKYVEASRWYVSGGSFSIMANIQPLLFKGSGVYTVVEECAEFT